jgi:vesicle coat complex subunit
LETRSEEEMSKLYQLADRYDLLVGLFDVEFNSQLTLEQCETLADKVMKVFTSAEAKKLVAVVAPTESQVTSLEPVAKTPWDWIANKNQKLTEAAMHPANADMIMTLLRALEVWAHAHGYEDVRDIKLAQATWKDDGLFIQFAHDPSF